MKSKPGSTIPVNHVFAGGQKGPDQSQQPHSVRWKFLASAPLLLWALLSGGLPGNVQAEENHDNEAPAEPPIDPDAPPAARIPLLPGISYGVKLELAGRHEDDFDLDGGVDDQQATLDPEIDLALAAGMPHGWSGFLALELSRRFALDEPRPRRRDTRLTADQVYLRYQAHDDVEIKFGRQRIKDAREWLFDDELDGVRAQYRHRRYSFDILAARQDSFDNDLFNSRARGDVNVYAARAGYDFGPREWAVYYLAEDDQSGDRESPIFIGLQSQGRITHKRWVYWTELAAQRGRDSARRLRGYGFDLGSTYVFKLPWQPALTVSYAQGSGDGNGRDNEDQRFRQTRFANNADRYSGVTNFRYYGEVLDPELSNIQLLTVGIGIRPSLKKTSIDLIAHDARQHRLAETVRTGLDIEANGHGRRLGHELDLVVGYRGLRDVSLELITGVFRPGAAFAERDDALLVALEVQYTF